jgi:hypothetical protein
MMPRNADVKIEETGTALRMTGISKRAKFWMKRTFIDVFVIDNTLTLHADAKPELLKLIPATFRVWQ